MKWQALLAGALASVLATNVAFAAVRVTNDPGGEISSYVAKFREMRADGERLVIDGPCLSACTLFTAFIPRDHVCVTRRAVLGFHAASYFDDTSRSLVPTRAGTRLVMHLYPAQIRAWIARHGGLTPQIITMRGRELASLYNVCRWRTLAAPVVACPFPAYLRRKGNRCATLSHHSYCRGQLILALAGTLWLWAQWCSKQFAPASLPALADGGVS